MAIRMAASEINKIKTAGKYFLFRCWLCTLKPMPINANNVANRVIAVESLFDSKESEVASILKRHPWALVQTAVPKLSFEERIFIPRTGKTCSFQFGAR